MDLNSQQRRAAYAPDGAVAIVAGPGTGKTKTLVERLRFLVASGVLPAAILALTFTKKAAQEMAGRFGSQQAPHISTFHALCFELLAEKRGEQPQFIAEPARLALIKKLPRPADIKRLSTRELSLLVSRAKNGAEANQALNRLVADYNQALADLHLHDFDDLLVQTRDLLQHDPTWRLSLQKRFTHILVDEFQDTNALQYELLQLLRGNDNLFVIGDPLQSIYGFRGAAGDIFATFTRDFPQATTIALQTNYRSAQNVVRLANAIYPSAPALVAHDNNPGDVRATEVLNEHSEAAYVLAAIQQAIGGSDLQRAVSTDRRADQLGLADIAIVYRSRTAARVVQKQIDESGIPFQVVGEGSPYEMPDVQTIIQLFAQRTDPARQATIAGLSPTQVAALVQHIAPDAEPHEAAVRLAQLFGFEITDTLRQFLGTLVRFKTVAEASAYFDGIAAQNFYDPRADAVTLLTIHAAKGLEFAHVFLIGAEEGILPSKKGDEAEEKRLFYVAATRAKQRLDILRARTRGGQPAKISRFVAAIAPTILPRFEDPALHTDTRKAQKRHAKRAQTSLF